MFVLKLSGIQKDNKRLIKKNILNITLCYKVVRVQNFDFEYLIPSKGGRRKPTCFLSLFYTIN